MTSRRSFIKTAASAGALLGLGWNRALAEDATRQSATNSAKARAKNLIFMVADGMNTGSLAAARHYQQLVLEKDNAWLSLFNTQPVVRSLVETSSATGIVTDSSAASSCWGCGQRILNGQVNMSVDGRPLEPICVTARKNGLATGLVTTATATHATPAGFAANSDKRNDEAGIARQYLERKIDIIMGGGVKFFDDTLQGDFRKGGYSVIKSRQELMSQGDGFAPLLGLFSDSHLAYTIDRNNDADLQEKVPTLAEMASLALRRLSKAPNGFVLQIEGARVDHAAHSNDTAALILDLIAFDEAVAVARDFVEKNPDTLLVITTDHGTGGMNINGVGSNYAKSTDAFKSLGKFKASYSTMRSRAKSLDAKQLATYLEQATGIRLKGDKLMGASVALNAVKAYSPAAMEGKSAELAAQGLGSLQQIFKPYTGVGWTSSNHTGDLVELTALGPCAREFTPFIRNDQVHGILLKALGIV
ncbi:MAG: alkaline phosphatase [Puniceicoccales bacterium]|jgi:alkaline phosphatase|nr:alkaline phosphatase [Puniceicoccales bacterium]